ncbi:hypothetical protein [Buchananella hordeovulneris]|uniref:Uncharacterized protein n=1 Tax=Buchananella hordeovulneris TaxID=52770 RepID=A0A1Q5PYD2_9ACTO|nr:hypothetical protein [Buchananella hordeovulneris]OKL52614.1 hypothetical protein BSZ40_00400 [Buchananella hordeovulneris]
MPDDSKYKELQQVAQLPSSFTADETGPLFDTIAECKVALEKFREATGLVGQTASQLTEWSDRMFRLLEVQAEHVGHANEQYTQAIESLDVARQEFAQLSPELMTPAEKERLGQVKIAYKNGEMMSGPELAEAIAADRKAQRDALAEKTLNTMNTALREVGGAIKQLKTGLEAASSSNDVLYGPPPGTKSFLRAADFGSGATSAGGGGGFGGAGSAGGLPGGGSPGSVGLPAGLRGAVLPNGVSLPGGPGLPAGPSVPGGPGMPGGSGGPVGVVPDGPSGAVAPIGKVHLQLRPDGPVTGYTPPAVNQLDSPAWRSDYQIPGLPKPPSHGLAGGVLGGVSAGGAALASRLGPSSTAAAVGRVAPMGGVMGMPGLGAPTATGGARVGGARPPVGGMLAPSSGTAAGAKAPTGGTRPAMARPGAARAGMGPVSGVGATATSPAGKPTGTTGSARPAGAARPAGGVWGANSAAGGKDKKDQRAARPHLLGYQPTRLTEEDAPQIDPSIYGAGNAQNLRPAPRDDSDEW